MKRTAALLLTVCMMAGCTPSAGPVEAPPPPSSATDTVRGQNVLFPEAMLLGSDEVPAEISSDTPYSLTTTTVALPPFTFSDGEAASLVAVYTPGDDTPLFEGSAEAFAGFAPPKSGTYDIVVTREWPDRGDGGYAGSARYHLAVTYDLAPVLTLEGAPVKQGGTALLVLKYLPEGQQSAQVTVSSSIGFTPTFYPYKGEMVALLPARYMLEKGTYHLTAAMGGRSWEFDFVIHDGEFESEPPFDVPISGDTNLAYANQEFNEATAPLKQIGDAEKYWEGAFSPPLEIQPLRVSSSFGYTRTINGNIDRHGGIDYPAPLNTPVYAPNHGRVLFAGELILTGYTICIEHGFGLKSWYYHMCGVTVEAGEKVEKGQQIGLVGSEGIYTTGSHLHFAMTVNGAFINPGQFLEGALLE